MNRRGFLGTLVAGVGGLLLPYTPERVYSFARELKVPVIEFDSTWHRFKVEWDGFTMRGLIDDKVVVESVGVPKDGIFFERGLDGNWRGKLGNPADDKYNLLVEHGDVHVDLVHAFVSQKDAKQEAIMRFESAEARFRLGWGNAWNRVVL